MTSSDFAGFYKAVHGYPPFPWQEELLRQVLDKGWPETLNLPTSSGKTSAIDVAVFHLALEAGKSGGERKAALRIFFVIDRRVVVDEAAEHARKLADALASSTHDAVRPVADALKTFGAREPLGVAVLRGGTYRENSWADEPNQPLVCVSTVDQVGSRLLFRGYQVSDGAKPVHAALVGNDALMVVDEAHLSQPFLSTLRAAEHGGASIRLVQMSATLSDSSTPFGLSENDWQNEVLGKRLRASKSGELRAPAKDFEAEMARAAQELATGEHISVVGVIANTVDTARKIYKRLESVRDSETILLTGRCRPYDSQDTWKTYKTRIAAKKDRVREGLLFVVATQTIEVGANLDFDALVTESAPLDALRQRYGRLNRLGERGESVSVIVRRPGDDCIYGSATAKTWELLSSLNRVDFGVLAMSEALKGRETETEAACSARENGPFVFPQYLAAWAQTNPRPAFDPDVAPFLHGKNALEDADVQLVWREDLNFEEKNWDEILVVAPPVTGECLPMPLGALRRWLRGEKKVDAADIEGVQNETAETKGSRESKTFVVWQGADKELRAQSNPNAVRPGDVVVVPAHYGGCDKFGWDSTSKLPVIDIGDEANNQAARRGIGRPRIRLNSPAKNNESLRNLIKELQSNEDDSSPDEITKKIETILNQDFTGTMKLNGSATVANWPRQHPDKEDQPDDSVGQDKTTTLTSHTEGVTKRTREYATRCGLSAELVDDLVLAAQLHDLGKCDERFQAWLCYCSDSPREVSRIGEPLAKSQANPTLLQSERRAARVRAEYPDGARHEAGSVMIACASGALARAHDRDLVVHLIGTHHGHGRPLLPVWSEADGEQITASVNGNKVSSATGHTLGRVDSGWLDRFAALNEKYGCWKLAFYETVLRRADCMHSREEQRS